VAENKTQPTKESVAKFLKSIEDENRRKDSQTVAKLMEEITGEKPVLWGTSIVGFGTYRYKGASGREGDWMLTGFSPRKQNLTLYLMGGFAQHADLMEKLGKYTTSAGSCLYIKRLDDIHLPTLKKLVRESVKSMKKMHVK
jgi:hypothetical protein